MADATRWFRVERGSEGGGEDGGVGFSGYLCQEIGFEDKLVCSFKFVANIVGVAAVPTT